VDERGHLQPSCHRFPTLGSELAGALLLPGVLERRLNQRVADPAATHVAADDIWLLGAALLVRASAFREIGGFDERFFLYSEETDLAFRLRQHGWISCFCDRAVVQHAGEQSTRGSFERMLGHSRWRYVRLHWSRPARISLVALLAWVYLWNSIYVAVRVAASPRSYRDKLEWWRTRWVKRPLPPVRAGHRAAESMG
jgi:GT2 family glycosyltransferase